MASKKVRVAIIGMGNCASSLVQGVQYYKNAAEDAVIPGIMHRGEGAEEMMKTLKAKTRQEGMKRMNGTGVKGFLPSRRTSFTSFTEAVPPGRGVGPRPAAIGTSGAYRKRVTRHRGPLLATEI